MSDVDSVDIIEEKLNKNKVNVICQQIILHQKTLWCFSLRKCSIEDQ